MAPKLASVACIAGKEPLMDSYSHRVVALYRSRATAAQARDQLLAQGFAPEQVRLEEGGSGLEPVDVPPGTQDVFADLLRGAAVGRAVGVPAGTGVSIVLTAADLSLFIASPVLGALYVQGWGASLGGLVGPLQSLQGSKSDVVRLFRAAWLVGQAVVVVEAKTVAETARAERVFSEQVDPPARRPLKLRQRQSQAAMH